MKILLSLAIGAAVVLTFGLARAEDGWKDSPNSSDKMITNDDLNRGTLDENQATVNQTPSKPGAEGSAAGGVTDDSGSIQKDSDQGKAPADMDKGSMGTEDKKPDSGGMDRDSDTYHY